VTGLIIVLAVIIDTYRIKATLRVAQPAEAMGEVLPS
jgi:hypothetical protein